MTKSTTPCPGCGAIDFHTRYSGAEGKRMQETGECFTCAFWERRAAQGCELAIDECIYSIGHEPSDEERRRQSGRGWSELGMSGRRFDIEFITGPHAGQRYTTHNLWYGGDIPERFRDRLPNTARFITGAERVKVGETTCFNPVDSRTPKYPAYR